MILWLFGSALLAGFFASSHCVVMCSPLAAAVGSQVQANRKFAILLWLNVGRVFSYSLLGLFVGAIGASVVAWQQTASALLQLVAGLFVLAMALYVAWQWQGLRFIEQAGQPIWRRLSRLTPKLLPINSIPRGIAYGLVWGYLPCGLIYSNLSVALSSGSALHGGVWMAGFGIGTSFAIAASLLLSRQVTNLLQEKWIKLAAASLLALYATTLIYLALHRLVF